MSRKKTDYSTEFKKKIVLEVLRQEQTVNEIAVQYNVIPRN
ncbi:MAG: transposase, partial [Candidatus Melainabacteria bacterium]|nr:transposase [Candidatus Melainabacteria bacterium]